MPVRLYYRTESADVGPVSAAELKYLIDAGTIAASSMVRDGDDGAWFAAGMIAGLLNAPESGRGADDPADEIPAWHFNRKGQSKQGPVSWSELKAMIADKKLLCDDVIWQPGMALWVPVGQVKGLVDEPMNTTLSEPSPWRKAWFSGRPGVRRTSLAALVPLLLLAGICSWKEATIGPSRRPATEVGRTTRAIDMNGPAKDNLGAVEPLLAEARTAERVQQLQRATRPVEQNSRLVQRDPIAKDQEPNRATATGPTRHAEQPRKSIFGPAGRTRRGAGSDSDPQDDVNLATVGRRSERVRSAGRELFERVWVEHDPRGHGGDGLGPVFNAPSCVACHNLGGSGGAGKFDANVQIATVTGASGDGTGNAFSFSTDFGAGLFEDGRRGSPGGFALHRSHAESTFLPGIHPGFRDANSIVLHRHGTDPAYHAWRSVGARSTRAHLDPERRGEYAGIIRSGTDRRHSRRRHRVGRAAKVGRCSTGQGPSKPPEGRTRRPFRLEGAIGNARRVRPRGGCRRDWPRGPRPPPGARPTLSRTCPDGTGYG